jgi:hypothetical protein
MGQEITLLEEELLPAMAVFLTRGDAIDRAIEADQEAGGRPLAGLFWWFRWQQGE